MGALGVVRGVAVVIGTLAAGLLGERLPIVAVISYQGVAYMTAGVVILVLLRRWMAESASESPAAVAPTADESFEASATASSAADRLAFGIRDRPSRSGLSATVVTLSL